MSELHVCSVITIQAHSSSFQFLAIKHDQLVHYTKSGRLAREEWKTGT